MRKYLITIYKILGFIINPLIILAMLFWLINLMFDFDNINFSLIDYLIGLLLSWASITWIYYIIKTKGIKKLSNSNIINIKSINDKYIERFKLDTLIGITNICYAIILIIYAIYILLFEPIKTLKDDELFRMITIIISLIYSILQIKYTILVFRIGRK